MGAQDQKQQQQQQQQQRRRQQQQQLQHDEPSLIVCFGPRNETAHKVVLEASCFNTARLSLHQKHESTVRFAVPLESVPSHSRKPHTHTHHNSNRSRLSARRRACLVQSWQLPRRGSRSASHAQAAPCSYKSRRCAFRSWSTESSTRVRRTPSTRVRRARPADHRRGHRRPDLRRGPSLVHQGLQRPRGPCPPRWRRRSRQARLRRHRLCVAVRSPRPRRHRHRLR